MNLRPILPYKSHPIYNGRNTINTNAIDKMLNDVMSWIENRAPGGIIFSMPRMGKTRAVKYVADELKHMNDYSNLAIYSVSITDHRPSENYFYTTLLKGSEHSFIKGNAADKKERLINFYIQNAITLKSNIVILFIDEAQLLDDKDFVWLMDIYNNLDRAGVRLVSILVGTPELISLKNSYIKRKMQQIVGRFMIHEHKFTGIMNTSDLQICLAGYDFAAKYPIESDWTFTKFFFPEAFNKGYMLSKDSTLIFESFEDVLIENSIFGKIEIPMHYLISAIDNCLRVFGADGLGLYWPTKVEWKKAIISSGYILAEGINEDINGLKVKKTNIDSSYVLSE